MNKINDLEDYLGRGFSLDLDNWGDASWLGLLACVRTLGNKRKSKHKSMVAQSRLLFMRGMCEHFSVGLRAMKAFLYFSIQRLCV